MSRWPSPQDYREAIQNPLHCFNDPDLRFSSVALDALQMPQVQCGNFAAVFKLSLAQQSWAVRCFLHDSDERRDRYRQISQYLQRCNLEEFVGFELIDRGIKFAGEFFPVLKMQFVEGTPLGAYIREKRQDPEELRSILDQFNSLMLRLKEAGIAHGDLQHDNIIVSDKKLKLVDYDGMYVPTMLQKESKELGHRNYQHPQRSKKHFGAYLDNFSAWLIRSSLECLIEKPSLFERLNKDDESILLDHKDLSSPYTSESFWQLEREGERSKTLSRRLRSLLLLPVEEINSIDNEPQDFSKLPPLIRSFASSWDENSVVVSPKQTKVERIEDVSDSMPEDEFICLPVFARNDISDYSVLKPFSTVLLFSTSSESRMPYWSELQRRTRSTLAKDEKEIWTCLEFLSEPVPMNSFFARIAPDPAIKFSFIAAAGLFLLALFLYTADLIWFLLYFCFAFIALPPLFGWKSQAKPTHIYYMLTNRNLKIAVETGRETLKGANHLPKDLWNVLLIDIPIGFIESVRVRASDLRKVDLTVAAPSASVRRSNTVTIALNRLNPKDWACLRMHLSRLGIREP